MRIISGSLGGRVFRGKIPAGIRPTSDKVRESIFNKLTNLVDIEDAVVADICSGTGAMGMEALSRGAGFCVFVDKSKNSTAYLRSAAEFFGIPKEKYLILQRPAENFPKYFKENFGSKAFDIAFCDPPYALNIINQLLFDINLLNLLSEPKGIMPVEYASDGGIVLPDGMKCIDKKSFGITSVSYITNDNFE